MNRPTSQRASSERATRIVAVVLARRFGKSRHLPTLNALIILQHSAIEKRINLKPALLLLKSLSRPNFGHLEGRLGQTTVPNSITSVCFNLAGQALLSQEPEVKMQQRTIGRRRAPSGKKTTRKSVRANTLSQVIEIQPPRPFLQVQTPASLQTSSNHTSPMKQHTPAPSSQIIPALPIIHTTSPEVAQSTMPRTAIFAARGTGRATGGRVPRTQDPMTGTFTMVYQSL